MPSKDILSPEETINSDKQLKEFKRWKQLQRKLLRNTMEFGPAEIGYFLVYPNI